MSRCAGPGLKYPPESSRFPPFPRRLVPSRRHGIASRCPARQRAQNIELREEIAIVRKAMIIILLVFVVVIAIREFYGRL